MDFEIALIECVRNYPVLYNSREKNYKNIITKESCWMEVAAKLNATTQECKYKWRNIRDSYRRNRNKKKAGNAASVSKYNDERLMFLDGTLGRRGTFGDIDSIIENEDADGDNTYSRSPTIEIVEVRAIDYPETKINVAVEGSENTTENTTEAPRKKRTKRKKKDDLLEELKRAKRTLQLNESNPQGDTAVHMFFNSMAEIVCRFPPKNIAEVRMKICKTVSEIELDVLTNQTRHSEPSSTARQDRYSFRSARQRPQRTASAGEVSTDSDSTSST